MADRRNTPWDGMAERVAELLKQQLNKPGNQAQNQEQLSRALEKLIDQQQQTNEQLQQLHTSTDAQTKELRDWRETNRQSASKQFFRKMLMEVPPVVLAVLLAFGINSWWQQRKAGLAAEKAYRNIITEIEINLGIMESVIEDEERSVNSLDEQIQEVSQGEFDPDESYGGTFNTISLRNAAWQSASISNALGNIEDSIVMDLTWVYETARMQEEYKQVTLAMDLAQKYDEETLLPFLQVNRSLLNGHINQTEVTANVHREFLEKYGALVVIDN